MINKLKRKLSRITNGINAENLRLKNLIDKNKGIELDTEAANRKLDDIIVNIKKLENAENEIKIIIKELNKKLADKASKLRIVKKELDDIDNTYKEKESLLLKKNNKIITESQTKISSLKSGVLSLNNKIEKINEEKDVLLEANKVIAGGNETLKKKKVEIDKEVSASKKNFIKELEELNEIKNKVERAKKTLAVLEAKEELINKEIESKTTIIASRNEEIKITEEKLKKAREEFEEIEDQKFAIARDKESIKEAKLEMRDVYKKAGMEFPEILL